MAMVDPGLEFWESVADGKAEALTMKAMHDMRRQNGG